MTSSNNVNIDLRPGTRLVRVTRGGREMMWVEENTLFGGAFYPGAWFWGLLIAIAFVVWGTDLLDQRGPKKVSQDNTTEMGYTPTRYRAR